MTSITPETTVVLVTGANQGIGLEIVKKLASEHQDYHVILSGRRPNAVQEAIKPLQDSGLNVSPLIMDIDSDESIQAAFQTVSSTFGRLDILINNSAISASTIEPLRARMQAIYNTNVFGTAVVTDTFIPLLAKSTKTKRIVFVSSGLASFALKGDKSLGFPFRKHNFGAYTHSKAALNMLALHYAADYEDDETWKFNVADPGHHCATNLNGFTGAEAPELGAISACMLATLGPEGQTGVFQSDQGTVPW